MKTSIGNDVYFYFNLRIPSIIVRSGRKKFAFLDSAAIISVNLRPIEAERLNIWIAAENEVRHNLVENERSQKMIFRIWHGWTKPENADIYEGLLKKEIFPEIASKNVSGYRGIQLLRRPLDKEVEFVTIMQFESLEAVKQFAGEDYEKSYVPDKARKVLARHDDRSQHYEMKASLIY